MQILLLLVIKVLNFLDVILQIKVKYYLKLMLLKKHYDD